jgi:opacity protein-like surface antigen
MKRSFLLSTAALAIAILPLGAAEAQDASDLFAGPYIGIHGGGFFGNVDVTGDEEFGGPVDGFIAGFLAGYNFPRSPVHNWMWGIEGDIGFGDINGNGFQMDNSCDIDVEDCVRDNYGYDINTYGHLRVRWEFPHGNWNIFAAGGVAFAHLKLTEGEETMYAGTFVGPSIGAGIETALGPNLTARAEGLYDWFGSKTVNYENNELGTIKLSGFTARAALILRFPPPPP